MTGIHTKLPPYTAPRATPLSQKHTLGNCILVKQRWHHAQRKQRKLSCPCVDPWVMNRDLIWHCVWVGRFIRRENRELTKTNRKKKRERFRNYPLFHHSKSTVNILVYFLPGIFFISFHRLLQLYYRHNLLNCFFLLVLYQKHLPWYHAVFKNNAWIKFSWVKNLTMSFFNGIQILFKF